MNPVGTSPRNAKSGNNNQIRVCMRRLVMDLAIIYRELLQSSGITGLGGKAVSDICQVS